MSTSTNDGHRFTLHFACVTQMPSALIVDAVGDAIHAALDEIGVYDRAFLITYEGEVMS
jgi:hypothetical protein